MKDFHAVPSLRSELRTLLELSVQPLNIYSILLKRFRTFGYEEVWELLIDPQTELLRDSVRDLLPDVKSPFLGMAARATLYNLISQTTMEEEPWLCMVLLEHFALQMEPYLLSAELDPDRNRYLGQVIDALELRNRPVDILVAARRAGARVIEQTPPTRLRQARD